MQKAILVLVFLLGVYSLQVLEYGFPFDPKPDPNVGKFNAYYSPSYYLGVISAGTSINIKVTLPDPLFSSLSLVSFKLFRSTNSSNYQMMNMIVLANTARYSEFKYDVISIDNVTQAKFWFRAIGPDNILEFDYFYLDITSYSTKGGLSVGSNSLQNILKVVQTQRRIIAKYIYLASPSNLTFQVTPANYEYQHNITISPITGSTASRSNGFVPSTPLTLKRTYLSLAKTIKFTVNNVSAGFYLVRLFANSSAVKTITLNFQTDAYLCPYSSDFLDYYLNFQGCTPSPASPKGLPCLSFSKITGRCDACINGYILQDGACVVNTTCPNRFYYQFGQCLPVNELCADYDAYTGVCLSCADTYNYFFSNGLCIRKQPPTCRDRQWLSNYICIDVSGLCQTFDPSNGQCLSCYDMYKLERGDCLPLKANCSDNQYAAGLNCFPLPAKCSKFDKDAGRCLNCIPGYSLQQQGGVCLPIICPERQVPSKRGAFCQDVSPLCDQYDSLTGDCLTCKFSNYKFQGGKCVQVVSSLAGCMDRQNMGFGLCANITFNCKTFNLRTGNCDACENGYYIDYTGICLPISLCGPREWSVNGQCMSMPSNCQSVDNIGLCTKCDDGYRIVTGQCIYFQTCLPRQYHAPSGGCVSVSPDCDKFNPSNGQCITCAAPGAQLSGGICCPAGTAYSQNQGACVRLDSFETLGGSACIIRHPSLNFCLKCPQGFSPDYTIPFNCAPN